MARLMLVLLVLAALVGALVIAFDFSGDTGNTHSDATQPLHPEATGSSPLTGESSGSVSSEDFPTSAHTSHSSSARTDFKEPLMAWSLGGLVLGPQRTPVEGASVNLVTSHPLTEMLENGRAVPVATTTSSKDGRYKLPLNQAGASWRRGVVMARATIHGEAMAGTCTFRAVAPSRDGMPLPPIVLNPVSSLRVQVNFDGTPVSGAVLVVVDGASNTVIANGIADVRGRYVVSELPVGTYRVFAKGTSEDMGRGRAELALPLRKGESIDIALDKARSLRVNVVDSDTNQPVAGARVLVGTDQSPFPPRGLGIQPPLAKVETDARGLVTLTGLSMNEGLQITAVADGYSPDASALIAGKGPSMAFPTLTQNEVTIALTRGRMVRFPISAASVNPPADGDTVLVRSHAAVDAVYQDVLSVEEGGRTARVVAGHVELTSVGDGWRRGQFVTHAGDYADFQVAEDITSGRPVTFRSGRAIVVEVARSNGDPAKGLSLRLRVASASGNALATTDNKGIARFDYVAGDSARLFLHSDGGDLTHGEALGKINLRSGQEAFRFTLGSAHYVAVQVRIDGESSFPAVYSLTVMPSGRRPSHVVEDRATNTLKLRIAESLLPKNQPWTLRMAARGYALAEATIAPTEVASSTFERPAEVTMNLIATGSLSVRVTPPEEGTVRIVLEKRHADGGWTTERTVPPATREGGWDEPVELRGLKPGAYRLYDTQGRAHSEVVSVTPGSPALLWLDLTDMAEVKGRVVGGDGMDLTGATVVVIRDDVRRNQGSGYIPTSSNIPVNADGHFVVRVLRDSEVTLTVSHPIFAAAKTGGTRTIKGGEGDVQLRLAQGTAIAFRIAGFTRQGGSSGSSSGPTTNPDMMGGGNVMVDVYEGTTASGATPRTLQPLPMGDQFMVGDMPQGPVVLVFRSGSKIPIERQINLRAGRNDLGTISFEAGGKLVVKISGSAIPNHVRVVVRHVGAPEYERTAYGVGPATTVTVNGLGAGTFRWSVFDSAARSNLDVGPIASGRITLDGRGSIELAVALD